MPAERVVYVEDSHPHKTPRNKSKMMPRDISLRREAERTDLKIEFADINDVLAGKVVLSDPCIVGDTAWDTNEAFEKKFPAVRKITFADVDSIYLHTSAIRHDTFAMSRDIMAYLTAAKRCRVAAFGFDKLCVYSRSMVYALQNTAKVFDVPFFEADVFWNGTNLEECFAAFARQIKQYDAVICVNDHAAGYILVHADAMGIRVPEDLFVIGRGNTCISSEMKPSITTIEIMNQEVGKQAIALFWYLKKHPQLQKVEIMVQHKLLVRESTAGFVPDQKILPAEKNTEPISEDRGYEGFSRLERMLTAADAEDRKIMHMMQQGKTTEEIAEALYLTESTVKYRVRNIAQILGVKSRKEICDYLAKYLIVLKV